MNKRNKVLLSLVSLAMVVSTMQSAVAINTTATTAEKTPIATDSNSFGDYGIWSGEIDSFTTTQLEGNANNLLKVVVANCDDQPYIFVYDEQQNAVPLYAGLYQVIANANSYVMSVIVNSGGWVETQNWSFIAKDNNNLVVQGSRQVSNPMLDNNDRLRAFGQMGYGEIKKTEQTCDGFLQEMN